MGNQDVIKICARRGGFQRSASSGAPQGSSEVNTAGVVKSGTTWVHSGTMGHTRSVFPSVPIYHSHGVKEVRKEPLFEWNLCDPNICSQRDHTRVKALEAFLRHLCAPYWFREAGYTGVPTEHLQPWATSAKQLPSPLDVVHINVVDATLLG